MEFEKKMTLLVHHLTWAFRTAVCRKDTTFKKIVRYGYKNISECHLSKKQLPPNKLAIALSILFGCKLLKTMELERATVFSILSMSGIATRNPPKLHQNPG